MKKEIIKKIKKFLRNWFPEAYVVAVVGSFTKSLQYNDIDIFFLLKGKVEDNSLYPSLYVSCEGVDKPLHIFPYACQGEEFLTNYNNCDGIILRKRRIK